MIHYFWAYSHGLTEDRLRLYFDDFCQIPANPPPVDTQAKIADALDAWDRAIEMAEVLLAAKHQRTLQLRDSLILGSLRLPGYAHPIWEQMPIGEVGRVVSGATPSTTVPGYWDGDIPWCTPTDITALSGRYIAATERTVTKEGLAACAAELLPPRSIILCSRASVGECAINTVPLATNQGFKSIVPNTKVDHRFLFYALTSSKPALMRLAAGSTFLEFSKPTLETFVISVPPRDEQAAIADVLDTAFDELELSSEIITKLKRQKCGLMEKLLSGDWRLAALADTTPAKVLAAG